MLRLQPKQLALLSAQRKAAFVKRLTAEVSSSWPQESALMGPDRLPVAVGMMVERGLAYGFRIEYDVARFVTLAFAFRSAKFDLQPWAGPILAEETVPPRI